MFRSEDTTADDAIYVHLPGRDVQRDKQAVLALLQDAKKIKGLILQKPGVEFFRLVQLSVKSGLACLQRNSLSRECRAAETPHPVMVEMTRRRHLEDHCSADTMFGWYKTTFPPRYRPQISYILLMCWASVLECEDCRLRYPEVYAQGYWYFYECLKMCQRADKAMVLAMLQWEEGHEKMLTHDDKQLEYNNEYNKLVQNVGCCTLSTGYIPPEEADSSEDQWGDASSTMN